MSNNTILNPGVNGDIIQTFDNTTFKTQAVVLVDRVGANTANIDSSGFLSVKTNALGTIAGGNAPANSDIVGGIYNSTRLTLTNGQGSALQLDAAGSLYSNVSVWSVANTTLLGKVSIDQTISGTTNRVVSAGGNALNSTSTENPSFNGGIALVGANPTKATNGQRTGIATDAIGRIITVTGHERTMTGANNITINNSNSEIGFLTSPASTFYDLTLLVITNSGANNTLVTIREGLAGRITGIYHITATGGAVIPFNPPLSQGTVANTWTAQCNTSTSSIQVNSYYINNS